MATKHYDGLKPLGVQWSHFTPTTTHTKTVCINLAALICQPSDITAHSLDLKVTQLRDTAGTDPDHTKKKPPVSKLIYMKFILGYALTLSITSMDVAKACLSVIAGFPGSPTTSPHLSVHSVNRDTIAWLLLDICRD